MSEEAMSRYIIIDSTGARHEVDELPDWLTPQDTVLTNHWIALPPFRRSFWDHLPWSKYQRLVRAWKRAAR